MIANSVDLSQQSRGLESWTSDVHDFLSKFAMTVNSHEDDSMDSDDAMFIARSLNGDNDAFGKLIEKYQNTIAVNMRRFSRENSVVEELVHNVFVEAFLSLKSFRSKSPFVHWLRRIAVRVGYKYWKQQSKRQIELTNDSALKERLEQFSSQSTTDKHDAAELIALLLERLAPRDRLVLTLLYWEGLSTTEAANRMGWSKTLVKVQAHRARKRLKKIFEETQQ